MPSNSTTDNLQKPAIQGSSGEKRRSVLHADVLIKGDWTSDGVVEFGGEVVGDITADVLVLTSEGRVTGNVRARNVTIEGRLEGTVSAISVVVKTTAKVTADIKADQILIESGAEIQGNIRVAGKSAEDDT
jgi:cytoskeletal protein CcmA (bactofilin family)